MPEWTTSEARVHLWESTVGTLVWDHTQRLGHFSYHPGFVEEQVQVAPMTAPLGRRRFAFPDLNTNVFKGLPGFLADSLPDRFGTAIIDSWLAQQNQSPQSLNPVERLCLIGDKGMGALEYSPALPHNDADPEVPLDIATLVDVINLILSKSDAPHLRLTGTREKQALDTLMQIGISADGARAKAVVAWNPANGELRPGHLPAAEGCGYWLLKFDGITGNRDREDASDPQGWGLIEYAYHLMAMAAGIDMMECRLLRENGRRHFVTRRFDRTTTGDKLHRQSLCAMGHLDFDALGAYSYEQVMDIMRDLGLPQTQLEQQFRRMVFNVLARNHDDHAKNIAFVMNRQGEWSLSPAYDLTFAYNPEGQWTNQHQMTLNGKRDNFEYADFTAVARRFSIEDGSVTAIVQQVAEAVSRWRDFAGRAGVDPAHAEAIAADLRLNII